MLRYLVIGLLGVGCAAPVARPERPRDVATSLALTHVSVVDVEHGRIASDQTLIVVDGTIRTLGASARTALPESVRVVDATGKYVIPGLWDMHVHPFNYVSGRPPHTWYLPRFISSGVTGVRILWVKPRDMPLVRKWREEVARGTLVGPRIGAAGTIVDGPDGAKPGAFPGPSVQVAATPAQGRQAVRDLQAAGVDFIKPYSHLSPETYFAITDEARRRHYVVAGHVPDAVSARAASEAGQRSIEHLWNVPIACSSHEDALLRDSAWGVAQERDLLDTYDPARCLAVARTFVKHHTAMVPTLVIVRRLMHVEPPEVFTHDPRLAQLPESERESWRVAEFVAGERSVSPAERALAPRRWKRELDLTRFLAEHGVVVLAGTDLGNAFLYPGSSLHDELALLVEAGLTPLEALQTATLNPARFLEIEDRFGTVAVGKTADLVVLDADPLVDIDNVRRIHAVILGGRLFDRRALDKLATAD